MLYILPIVYLVFLLLLIIVIFYLERKLAAFIQDRIGPNEVGFAGTLQPIADLFKMIQKEDIIPSRSVNIIFKSAPLLIFLVVFTGFAFLPISPGVVPVFSNVGVAFCMTVISLDIIGLIMAGWSAENKFAIIGSIRSVSQIVSYEIPVGITILSAVVVSGSMDLSEIAISQSKWRTEGSWLFGIRQMGISTQGIGGIFIWNIFQSPALFISYIIFYISTLAECNRAPFDLPEAESELVAGYHAEYSGLRFGIFFLAEYAMMVLVSILGAFLFLGAWSSPLPNIGSFYFFDWTSGKPGEFSAIIWSVLWVIIKTLVPCVIMIWIRWTFPRLRTDQLMYLCWKILIPFSILCFLLVCVSKYISLI